MNLEKLEQAALKLSKSDRQWLLRRLVVSLDAPSPEELRAEWLDEAGRRAADLDDGIVKAVPKHQVLKKARALVR